MSTGGAVSVGSSGAGFIDPLGSPNWVHHNTIIFTDPSLLNLKGINTSCRRVHISENTIIGATGRACVALDGGTIERNNVTDHHGTLVFGIYGSGSVVRGNRIYNFDGSSYPSFSSLTVCSVSAISAQQMQDVLIADNVLRNPLTAGGALSPGAAKTRFCTLSATGSSTLADVEIRNNRCRNLNLGIVVSGSGSVSNVRDIDNTWINETGSAVTNSTGSVTMGKRLLPALGYVSDFTVTTITGSATVSTTSGNQIVLIDTGGLPTLGTAVGCKARITLKNRTSAGVAISTTSTQTIDGASSFVLPAGQSIDVIADSTNNWSVI
jgi:hypothetical protein